MTIWFEAECISKFGSKMKECKINAAANIIGHTTLYTSGKHRESHFNLEVKR